MFRSTRLSLMFALVGLLASVFVMAGSVNDADAQLIDPATQPDAPATGPAQFFPAPNPNPYCDSSFVFPPWPGNIAVPTAPLPAPQTSSAGGVDATMTFTNDGDPTDVYPGSYGGVDQTKGFEFAAGDAATVTLSEPLFYSQWVFTDVDKINEGFILEPTWATNGPNAAAILVGETDPHITFDPANTENLHEFDHPATEQWQGYQLGGRVQVDYFGAITALDISRPADGDGQSGFAIGGGCVAAGVSKRVVTDPVWNGSTFEVTYEIKVRNNLPSTATLRSILDAALAAATVDAEYGTVEGIPLTAVSLTDDLDDPRFSQIDVVSLTNPTGGLTMNVPGYDGISDTNLITGGTNVPAESEESVLLVVEYTPDPANAAWAECVAPLELENTAEFVGSAGGVDVTDLSDAGVNPNPADNNGAGGVDDPTLATFECPPNSPELEIVKTVVAAGESCPATFADGVAGDGVPLTVAEGDTVTYCIAVRNVGAGPAIDVVVSDPLLGFSQLIAELAAGAEVVLVGQSYVVPADAPNPLLNTACAKVDEIEVCDTAIVESPKVEIVKTVVAAGESCPATFADGVAGDGEPLMVEEGDTVTYCIAVRNIGAGPAFDVVVSDPLLGFSQVIAELAGGAEVVFDGQSYVVPVDAPNPLLNTVCATVGDTEVCDTAVLDPHPLVPSISLEKTVLAGANADCSTAVEGTDELVSGPDGTAVTYCFKVTNTGGTYLLVAEVEDSTLGITIPIAQADQLLAPGESVTVSHNGTITGDLVNTASVTGDPVTPTGDPIPELPDVTDENDAEVDEPTADISIVKSVNDRTPALGQQLTYTLVVSNDGPDPAADVQIVDTLPVHMSVVSLPANGLWDCSASSGRVIRCDRNADLAPNTSDTLTYQAKVETTAAPGVGLTNVAKVTSSTDDPDLTDNEDTETVVPPAPVVAVPIPYTGPYTPPPPVVVPPRPAPLAVTGSPTFEYLAIGSVLLLSGGAFVIGTRRRLRD